MTEGGEPKVTYALAQAIQIDGHAVFVIFCKINLIANLFTCTLFIILNYCPIKSFTTMKNK
jgi:hypothetical protein